MLSLAVFELWSCKTGKINAAHAWLRSYLSWGSQYVRCGSSRSLCHLFGVWHSTVIGAGTSSVCSVHRWPHLTDRKPRSVTHLYADDIQVYGFCRPASVSELSASISECMAAVASWIRFNKLPLNADKTEVLWYTIGRRQHNSPAAHWRSTVQLFLHRHPSTTSGYIFTAIWWCWSMFRKLCRVALLSSVSCVKFVAQCHSLRSSR